MNQNDSRDKPNALRKEDLLLVAYIAERVARAIENVTGDLKDILTNLFGLGDYLKKLAEKDDPISYIPALMIVAGLIYFVAAEFGSERSGFITLIITFFLVTLILVFRFIENLQKPKR